MAIGLGVDMAQDPHLTLIDSIHPTRKRETRLRDIERRLQAIEINMLAQLVLSGEPTNAVREGTRAVSKSPQRFWVYVNGGWHYTTLT